MNDSVKEVEFEVLPAAGTQADEWMRLLAFVLDDLIPVPGTKLRVGLDPILGLIPGVGDSSAAAVSSVILFRALRAGVPRIVIARMAAHVLINALVGGIPGLGDLFSVWFKSNRRNYELLQKHASGRRASTAGDWIFLGSLLAVVFLGVAAVALTTGYVVYKVFALVFG